jgi:glyoxylase-like metal-dependent hydrolase (beta-lactamase superfamily II)
MTYHYRGEVWIVKLALGPYDNNCYVLIDPETLQSAIVDAPAEPQKVLDAVRGTQVKYLLITHTHADHLAGFREIVEGTGARVGVHPAEAHRLPQRPDFSLNDNDTLLVGAVPLRVLHTPGHTPGSCCLITGRRLFTGDTLFPGGPGHSSNAEDLQQELKSIAKKLLLLAPETAVYPGHGADTTIRQSQAEYRVFASKSHPPDLHGDILWLTS